MNKAPLNAQEIVAANDILEVIGSYFPIASDGSSYKALCPFHEEQVASFRVDNQRQTFHCFGCGAGGDVLQFVANYEHEDEDRALQKLAARVGIPIVYAPAAGQQQPEQTVRRFSDAESDADSALLLALIAKHMPKWKRIQITDQDGRVYVFEQPASQ